MVKVSEVSIDGDKTERERAATALDVTLLNAGLISEVLTRADVRIIRATSLVICTNEGGEISATGNYTIKLPPPVNGKAPAPQLVTTELHQEVPTGRPDRFQIAVGSAGDIYDLYMTIYELDVSLQHSGSDEPLALKRILVADKLPSDLDKYFLTPIEERPGCAAANRNDLKSILEVGAVRSGPVEALKRFVQP